MYAATIVVATALALLARHRDLEQDVRMHIQRFLLLLLSVGVAIGSGLPSCNGAAALFRRDFISIQTSTATVMAVSTRTTIVSIFKAPPDYFLGGIGSPHCVQAKTSLRREGATNCFW
jgi:hypothetical protein